jgi:hypothetical protein
MPGGGCVSFSSHHTIASRVARKEVNDMSSGEKKDYTSPTLKTWGKVRDLTQTGRTHPGGDGKDGSSASSGE